MFLPCRGFWIRQEEGIPQILLVVGGQRENVLRNEVDPHRMGKRRQKPGTEGYFQRLLGYVSRFLRDDQVHLPVLAVLQQPRPGFGAFHAGRGGTLIDIETHKVPVGAAGHGIGKGLFVKFQVIFVAGLVEIADIHRHMKGVRWGRPFPPGRSHPLAALCQPSFLGACQPQQWREGRFLRLFLCPRQDMFHHTSHLRLFLSTYYSGRQEKQKRPGAKNLTPGQKRENIYRKRRRSPAWMQWATS